MSSIFYYVFFGFMSNYLEHYIGLSSNWAFSIQSSLLILMLFLVPLAGLLGDRYSRKAMLILTAPAYYLMVMAGISLITATRLLPKNRIMQPIALNEK